MHTQTKENWRLYTLAIIFVLFWLIVVGRLIYIQAFQAKKYAAKASVQQSRKFEIPASRGIVYVKDSQDLYPIALNNKVYTLAVDPKFIKDADNTAQKLNEIINSNKDEIKNQIIKDSRYIEINKSINTDQAEKIKSMSLPGVILIERASRFYPEGSLFSHVLGYVNDDGKGQYGFEQFNDETMGGTNGQYNTTTDALGVPIRSADNTISEPVAGKDYVLTLDRGLQAVAQEALKQAVESNRAESGSIIVMDVKTGAIKAMVNYPDYDPNNFRQVKDYKVFSNSAVSSLFEPGSGFKVVTMAAGLDTGKIRPNTTFNDTGEVKVGDKVIKNAENHKFGISTMTDVIQKSLNTGVVFVLQSLGGTTGKITPEGKQSFFSYIEKFGFGKITGIEQAGEVSSKVKQPSTYDVDYANMSFGQGISVNSLQLLTAVGAIANKGVLMKPYLVEGELQSDQTIKKTQPQIVRGVISPETATELSQIMTQVVEQGSGYLTKMKGYKIAGKTGTAQVPRADGKGYEDNKNIGSFVGFAPADDPKFVMLVRVDYPKTEGFAEKTAVPAFATVAKELMRYYQIPPSVN
ncbi:MAG TPA: penicillin-binding protein 2 [Candidatus Saccharibacteria bacterium]|nr:penicillin-binding protein 2 [Candidatus Saccharibacteria bacterium]HMT39490.1 penicillin-binding protein 2 [Candidatus Saccharibacteria bacterium]